MDNHKKKSGKPQGVVSPHSKYKKIANDAITLQIFDLVEQNPGISQGKIKMQTGLASGLIHSFMKRIIEKGWVRARKVSPKRWLYFMTPDGFFEKSRLVMHHLIFTINAYRVAQKVFQEQLGECVRNGRTRLVIAGDCELASLAALHIKAVDSVVLVAQLSPPKAGECIGDFKEPSYNDIVSLEYDKIFVCDPGFLAWHRANVVPLDESKVLNIVNLMPLFF